MPKRRRSAYTEGQINSLIDSVLHPLMKGEDKIPVMLLDFLAHSFVEQDPQKSSRKFVKYTLPKLVNETHRREGKRRRRLAREKS